MFFDWNQTDLKIVQLLQLPVTAPHHAQVLHNKHCQICSPQGKWCQLVSKLATNATRFWWNKTPDNWALKSGQVDSKDRLGPNFPQLPWTQICNFCKWFLFFSSKTSPGGGCPVNSRPTERVQRGSSPTNSAADSPAVKCPTIAPGCPSSVILGSLQKSYFRNNSSKHGVGAE